MRKIHYGNLVVSAFCAFACSAGAQNTPAVLMPFQEATVASALDSELKDYHYRIGEAFTNGAVIAELDDSRYVVSFFRARQHRDFTARVAKEQLELRQKDFASEMELRKAEYEAKLASADYDEALINVRKCRFVAPFAGKISELLTQRYETVKPGQPLFKIIEDARLLAVANLPLGDVAVGQQVMFVPDGRKPVAGTVHEVAPQADNRTGTVRVRVLVANSDGGLTAGMTGVLVVGTDANAAEVPKEPPKAAEEDCRVPLESPGRPYATVTDAFQGVTPYAVVVSNEMQRVDLATNCPPIWSGREIEVCPLSDGRSEIRALPPLAIARLGFKKGLIGYELHRYPRSVSLTSLKRIGELTAGLYDPMGKRLAYIAPCQVSLPAAGASVTNAVLFSQDEYGAACAAGCPLRLILRIDSDVRALQLPMEGEVHGRE